MKKDIDPELKQKWQSLLKALEQMLGKRPKSLNAVLFLIGVQELGQGVKVFTKEQKQDLMHIAICRVLSKAGIYALEGHDQDGWPHWKLVNKLPYVNTFEQEKMLQMYVLEYFADEGIVDIV